ncbi:MAG: type I 3-dehydroquinate dehydratase [Thermoplasmata archaeon]|nr:type I 3-dehydroquinate dehydratase [Thermoplasmata archaeon]
MNPRPLLIVTLPGQTVRELLVEIVEGRAAGADMAEIRVDRMTDQERSHLSELFPAPLPLLGTYRSRMEGGEGIDDPGGRRQVVASLQTLGFVLLDRELRRDEPGTPTQLPSVRSVHLAGSSSPEEFAALIRQPSSSDGLGKVVVPASIGDLLDWVLPALPPPGEVRTVVLTTGASGPLLRVWARRFGFPATFGSLPPRGSGLPPRPPVEVSQLPVDQLRRWFGTEEGAPLYGVIGHPVAHSLSPSLHNAWMTTGGQPGLYVPLDLADGAELTACLPRLVELGFHGFNVTHPYKHLALELADEASPAAETCGAANVLTFHDGEGSADNTDLAALVQRLAELRREGLWDGERVTILGSGGGARAALEAARLSGAKTRVMARNERVGGELARRFGAELEAPSRAEASLVIHATPAGQAGGTPLDLPLENVLGPGSFLLDLVYAPVNPFLADRAARAGALYEDGWRLLIYQARESYRIWWGVEPRPEAVRTSLEERLCTA